MSTFWANNKKGDMVFIKDVGAALEKDYEPDEFQIILITKVGKLTWSYTSKEVRDNDIAELRRLKAEYQNKI